MNINLDLDLVQLCRDETFGHSWTLEDGRRFWKRIGGCTGMVRLARDAWKIPLICAALGGQQFDRRFLNQRRYVILLCVVLACAGQVLCIVGAKIPHLFGKFALETYYEMLIRANLVAEAYAPDFASIFEGAYGQKAHPNTHVEIT